jgi:chromate transporter
LSSINVASLLLTVGALIAVFRFRINMIAVLGTCAAIGIIYYLATGQVA